MNQKELKELIEFLIEKDIAEFELERGDVKVKIKRAGEHTVVHAHGEPAFTQCLQHPRRTKPELPWERHLRPRRQLRPRNRPRKKDCTR